VKTYQQTYEIIESIRSFHIHMRNFYERLHEKDENQRVKMLLDYLGHYEKFREKTLARFIEVAPRKVMDTWYKYIPGNISPDCCENIEIKSHMCVDDIFQIALSNNNCLIEFYEGMVRCSENKEVRDVFDFLLDRIKIEEKNLARDALWLHDL